MNIDPKQVDPKQVTQDYIDLMRDMNAPAKQDAAPIKLVVANENIFAAGYNFNDFISAVKRLPKFVPYQKPEGQSEDIEEHGAGGIRIIRHIPPANQGINMPEIETGELE